MKSKPEVKVLAKNGWSLSSASRQGMMQRQQSQPLLGDLSTGGSSSGLIWRPALGLNGTPTSAKEESLLSESSSFLPSGSCKDPLLIPTSYSEPLFLPTNADHWPEPTPSSLASDRYTLENLPGQPLTFQRTVTNVVAAAGGEAMFPNRDSTENLRSVLETLQSSALGNLPSSSRLP